ncbi:bifunctional 2',3'-cyclic-nucleotide 2'-phosphodiesterase/3'-nucleotidase, partial [Anaerobacillus alkaliphilus]
HAHIMPYDYMADAVDQKFGLAKVYTLVQQLRAKHNNTLLVDNGDIIQGSILGYIEAVVDRKDKNSIIEAMNMMGYDAGTIGNHEYNFGLPLLDSLVEASNFPWLSANTYNVSDDKHRYEPYVILDRMVDGKPIKIGVIGFVPPQVMIWDKMHLNGNIYVNEIVDSAKKYVPEMKAKGADVIVVTAHSGFDLSENASENASYQLSQIEGINALVTGHQHYVFPSSRYATTPGADLVKGTLNGVPTVMPGAWGDHLGVITLNLQNDNGTWTVVDGGAKAMPTVSYGADPAMVALVKDRHEQTIEYVNNPVGKTATPLNTYFSRVAPNKVVQLINDAQLEFGKKHFAGTEYENLPLLSAAAPFKAGRHGASYFTNVKSGIAIKDIADIYIYNNTLQIVKVDGKDLLKWLEGNANNFNQIDPNKTEDQTLLDYNFRGFNFDTIAGIEYQIDVTKPKGQRIVNVTYEGKPVTADMEFLVVANNYRASGGGDHLLGAPSVEIVYSGTEENREVIIDYVSSRDVINVELVNNWSIVPVETKGNVVFRSSPKGKEYIEANNLTFVSYLGEGADGWA